jgi:small subunit ribosomal protein S2
MTNEKTTDKIAVLDSAIPSAEDMVKAGVHFGHKTTKWNPKMAPFIFGAKNNVHILDLDKTIEMLKSAVDFIKEVAQKNGIILFVGTSPAAKNIVEVMAKQAQMPFVSERWLGGTLTNFKIISKRLEYFRELERKRDIGELKKYTKKEQLDFDEELKKLERKFGGIKHLLKIPNAIFVLDPKKNYIAVREAKLSKVKIIALCDTNIDPTEIDYVIPSNDDAIAALELMTKTIVSAIEEGRKNIEIIQPS